MRFPVAAALLALGGCSAPHRTLAIVPTLPSCVAPSAVNTVRLTALGDFAALPGLTASASAMQNASLSLPRETRVVDVEGFGPTGLAAFGRTAPLSLDDVMGGAVGLAYGPPDAFCATAQLKVARSAPQATLLPSGAVLISGGEGQGGGVTALELYLPDGDSAPPRAAFRTLAASIVSDAVLGHAVSVLPDGGVLISGGVGLGRNTPAGAIAYSGALRLFADGKANGNAKVLPGGSRAEHSATTLRDGRVLLAGGCAEFVAGSCSAGRVLATTALYNPVADSFSAGPALIHARYGHSAVLRGDGSVLIVGGVGEGGAIVPAEVFDPDEARGFDAGPATGVALGLPGGSVLEAGAPASASGHVGLWLSPTEPELTLADVGGAGARPPLVAALDDGGALIVQPPATATDAAPAFVFDGRSSVTPLSDAPSSAPGALARLADGTVLLVGSPAGAPPSQKAELYFRSPLSPFANLPPLTLEGPGDPYLPRRPDRAVAAAGQLVVTAPAPATRPSEYALVAAMQVADFDFDLLLGRRGAATVALVFGWQSEASHFFLALSPGQAASLSQVSAAQPGQVEPLAVPGCSGAVVTAADLPDGSVAHAHVAWRDGQLLVTTTRTLLSCRPSSPPPRGMVGVGALDGVAVFANLSLSR